MQPRGGSFIGRAVRGHSRGWDDFPDRSATINVPFNGSPRAAPALDWMIRACEGNLGTSRVPRRHNSSKRGCQSRQPGTLTMVAFARIPSLFLATTSPREPKHFF